MQMFEVKRLRGKDSNFKTTIRFPDDLHEQLSKYAQESGVSLNYLVECCCRYAMDNAENKKST
jgi:predicted HicB family RNase H-like nuclease